MKLLLKMMDRLRPAFHEGRLRLLRPAFDAIDFFLFAYPQRTGTAPHIRGPMSVKRYMSAVIVALMPCIAAAIYFFGWRIVPMIVVTYVVGLSIELAFAIARKEEINEGFFVTGLLYPLILPSTLPLWMVAVGVAFGVVVGKELFGGTGRNLFNPALVGRCFLALAYPREMASDWVQPILKFPGRLTQYITAADLKLEAMADAVSAATPLAAAKQGNWAELSDLLWGNVSGCVGETSAIAVLVGGVFLLVTRVGSWRTVAASLGSFAALAAALHWAQPDRYGPVLWHLLAGGFLFAAFFMATDPVTGPMTNAGKWVYGALIGVITVLIRNLTGYVEGAMFAILLGNIVAPILDEVVFHFRLRRLKGER